MRGPSAASHPLFAERLDKALAKVRDEVLRAASIHPEFHSPHEGYGVILEEVDELWDDIKSNSPHAVIEAKQAAAMCVRYLVAFDDTV